MAAGFGQDRQNPVHTEIEIVEGPRHQVPGLVVGGYLVEYGVVAKTSLLLLPADCSPVCISLRTGLSALLDAISRHVLQIPSIPSNVLEIAALR